MMPYDELLDEARTARERAYAPESGFSVGAAVLCTDGSVYHGANIENINYTNTTHAETLALDKAVYDGHRDFDAIAISCSGEPAAPCGSCRQSLSEFCESDLMVLVDDLGTYTLGELLPEQMNSL